VEDARVRRVHHEVRGARTIVGGKGLFPRLATIARTEDTAVRVRTPHVAERGDVDEVRVARVHTHARDLVSLLEADVLPRAAAVGGLVDAVAARDIAADRRLAHADIDHVRVRLGDGDRADR